MKRRCLCLLLALCFLCGCAPLFDREYYVESAHVEQSYDEVDTADLKATTYAQLKNAILQLVRSGKPDGDIRLEGYFGDVEHDLLMAIGEVTNEEPYGKYAVYVMSYKLTSVLSNYQADISVVYRRTKEQMDSILPVIGRDGLMKEIGDVMSGFQTELVVEMAYFDAAEYDPVMLVHQAYYTSPASALGLPELTVVYYPDTGLRRIIEMAFAYELPQGVMQSMAELVGRRAQDMADGTDTAEGDAYTLLGLHDALCASVTYDEQKAHDAVLGGRPRFDQAWTPYGALVEKLAVSEGYALAFKLLCDLSEIPCQVVLGKRDNDDHAWNAVQLDKEWYHVDVTADDLSGDYAWFLKTDADLEANYRWTAGEVPACTSRDITADLLLEQPTAGTETSPGADSPPPETQEPDGDEG